MLLQVREICAQASEIYVALAILLLILDDQQRTSVAEQLDHLQPVVKVGILLTIIRNKRIKRAAGEKKLVSGM